MKYQQFQQSNKLTLKIESESNKCIGCKLCMKNCPMLQEQCESPKDLLEDLSNEMYFDGTIKTIQMPFTCTLCSYCEQICPKDVSLKNVFYDLKTEVTAQVGFPSELGKTSLSYHQNLSFSSVFSTQFKKIKPKNNSVFIPGCSPSAYNPSMKEMVYNYQN